MGLKVYFPNDIRDALLAAEQAVNATADAARNEDDPFTAGFLTGYRAALTTLALAFGLCECSLDAYPRSPNVPAGPQLSGGLWSAVSDFSDRLLAGRRPP